MGRRKKSAKKVVRKVKKTVSKQFKCPYCYHDKSVEVDLNKKDWIGTIKCRVCGEGQQYRITYLSEAIDVFCEWKSDIHAAAEDDDEEAGGGDTAGSSLKDNDDGLDDD